VPPNAVLIIDVELLDVQQTQPCGYAMTEKQHDEGYAVTIFLVVVLSLPLLYLFSSGPLHWLCGHGYIDTPWAGRLGKVYLPLWYLRDHFTLCRIAVESWLSLWD
jgi:hypothetical protein